MFGKNVSRPLAIKGHGLLQVHEVFNTIQGEGPWSGWPAVFIRLSGCNLRCFFCDTKWDDDNDALFSPREIVDKVIQAACEKGRQVSDRVVLTGGEPARQDCEGLLRELRRQGFITQIETAGTYYPTWLWLLDQIVISPKTKNVHPDFYKPAGYITTDDIYPDFIQWKYVVRAGEVSSVDGLPTTCTQVIDPTNLCSTTSDSDLKIISLMDQKHGAPARPHKEAKVWLSPCNEYDEEKNKANREAVAQSCMRFGYRAQVQLHNYLNLP
jgi:organic radical activating enzyme